MTDLEISKALALAIGWTETALYVNHYGVLQIDISNASEKYPMWAIFDYRDWNVIGPIAKEHDAFPYQTRDGAWTVGWTTGPAYITPQKAIALAVIGANK